jgi:aryl-alcohol dehydrogenase-like predicted oxidoreductase
VNYKRLGNTNMDFSVIGLGTWAFGGGGWDFSWGPQDDDASLKAARYALDCGVNWIDTAAVYGLGHSEEVVGRVLQELPAGTRPYIATKCSRVWNENGDIRGSLKADSVKKECDDSLRRLGVDCIDLYQLHWPKPPEDIEEGWSAVADLVKEGKVRFGGVSNFTPEQMDRLNAIHPVASLQPPYSMLKRDIEEKILPYCKKNNIGVIVYSPLQKGMLTGKYDARKIAALPEDDHRHQDPLFHEPVLSPTLALVEKLKDLAAEKQITPAQLAIAWVLRRSEVTAAIAGARKPQQIEDTASAAEIDLSQDDIELIGSWLSERDAEIAALDS